MKLAFSQPVLSSDGRFQIRTAPATPEFWSLFRGADFATLQEKGLVLKKSGSGYLVQIYIPNSPEFLPPLVSANLVSNPTGLRPYQIPHVGHLMAVIGRHGAVIDGSDTGTGKTYANAVLCREMGYTPLVVCLKSARKKWAQVLYSLGVRFIGAAGWEESKGAKFPYTSRLYETISALGKPTRKVFTGFRWKVPTLKPAIIFDEAHKGKAYAPMTENARLMAASYGIPTMLLSATLVEKPQDLWAAGKLVGAHNGFGFADFCERFLCMRDAHNKLQVVDNETTSSMLHKFIYPEYGSRISIRDLGDAFPKNQVSVELVDVDGPEAQNDAYKHLIQKCLELESVGKFASALTERLRYRQAAEMRKVAAIIEMANADHEEGNAVAIFVCFKDSLHAIVEKLGRTKCAIIIGGQKSTQKFDEREDQRLLFENNKRPFIVCTTAGITSIDMHDLYGVPRVSLISPSDNARDLKQTLGRIHRDGSLSAARQKILCAAGTVEETSVYPNLSAKIMNIDTINDGDLIEPAFTTPCMRNDE